MTKSALGLAALVSPAYFILPELEAGLVKSIRDFRYASYIAAEAELEIVQARG